MQDVLVETSGPKSQGKRIGVTREEDGRRAGKGFNTFIDNTIPENLTEGLTESIIILLQKAKVEGKIVHEELINVVPNAEEDVDLVDRLYSILMEIGVEIIDATEKTHMFESSRDPEDRTELIDLGEISDDSIRMYLNEIGRYPLIDGPEEVRLGRLIAK